MQLIQAIAPAAAAVLLILTSATGAAAKSCERSCDESLTVCEAFPIAQERASCARQMNRWCDRFCDQKAAARPAALHVKKRP